jgi:SlyX protein
MSELSDRVDALEARIAYQDDTIETLNATITEQWKQIEALRRQLAALSDRLQDAEARGGGPTSERPPHY